MEHSDKARMNAEQTITNDTIMTGVVCKKCAKTLPPHSVKTHLEDPNNSIFKCPSHKPKQEGFKWGQELLKWKTAYEALQKQHEDWISKTLEENEGFLGEVRKSGFKEGQEEESAKTLEVQKKLDEALKELAGWNRQLEECELVPSESVLCSYDDVNDFIWGRVKDICREEQLELDGNLFIKEFKGIQELKKENEALKKKLAEARRDSSDSSDDDETTEIEPIPEGGCQKVRGQFHQEYTWIVPDGINLHDTDTYIFSDRRGVLTIINKETGEEWNLDEPTYCDDDFKYSKELEVVNYDANGDEIF